LAETIEVIASRKRGIRGGLYKGENRGRVTRCAGHIEFSAARGREVVVVRISDKEYRVKSKVESN
jgi:hypothetical protein